MVDEAFQRTGLATAAVRRFEADAFREGFRKARLDVELTNQPAFAFYDHCGYIVEG